MDANEFEYTQKLFFILLMNLINMYQKIILILSDIESSFLAKKQVNSMQT